MRVAAISRRNMRRLVPGNVSASASSTRRTYPDDVFRYQAAHDRFTTDMDTPADYARLLARLGAREATLVQST